MNRIDRLNALRLLLQSRTLITAQEIATHFEVTKRTVYRDIRALETAGVPIIGEAGLGYSLPKDYSLPPLALNEEEAISLLMGAKVIQRHLGENMSKVYEGALQKIQTTLTSSKQYALESLKDSVQVWKSPGEEVIPSKDQQFVLDIQKALHLGKKIKMTYKSGYKNEYSERLVNPIGVLFYSNNWHLIAWCNLRQEYRDFRIDRLSEFSMLEESFLASDYLSLYEYTETQKAKFPVFPFQIHIHKSVAHYIEQKKLYMGFTHQKEIDDSWLEMNFLFSDEEFFARWTLMHGNKTKVISPQTLIERRREIIEELYLST